MDKHFSQSRDVLKHFLDYGIPLTPSDTNNKELKTWYNRGFYTTDINQIEHWWATGYRCFRFKPTSKLGLLILRTKIFDREIKLESANNYDNNFDSHKSGLLSIYDKLQEWGAKQASILQLLAPRVYTKTPYSKDIFFKVPAETPERGPLDKIFRETPFLKFNKELDVIEKNFSVRDLFCIVPGSVVSDKDGTEKHYTFHGRLENIPDFPYEFNRLLEKKALCRFVPA
jgi:hypothetical protein